MINAKEARRISKDSIQRVLESDEDIVWIYETISESASYGQFKTEVTVLLNWCSNNQIRPIYVCRFLQEMGYSVAWGMTEELMGESFPVYRISWENV